MIVGPQGVHSSSIARTGLVYLRCRLSDEEGDARLSKQDQRRRAASKAYPFSSRRPPATSAIDRQQERRLARRSADTPAGADHQIFPGVWASSAGATIRRNRDVLKHPSTCAATNVHRRTLPPKHCATRQYRDGSFLHRTVACSDRRPRTCRYHNLLIDGFIFAADGGGITRHSTASGGLGIQAPGTASSSPPGRRPARPRRSYTLIASPAQGYCLPTPGTARTAPRRGRRSTGQGNLRPRIPTPPRRPRPSLDDVRGM